MPPPIVAVCASGEVSGAEQVLLALIDQAVADGADVTVAAPAGPLAGRLGPGVRHVMLPSAGRGGVTGRFGRAVATVRWLGSWVPAARRIRADARRPGTRLVVNSLLALPPVRLARPPGGAVWLVHDVVVSARQRLFVRFAARSLQRVVAVSEAAAAPLRALGLTVEVRPNGVAWPVDPRPAGHHEPPIVGSVGLLAPWKGTHVLLDAVSTLPDVRLEIAGGHFEHDRAYVDELRARAQRADLAGRVTFLGHTDDALATMRGWDLFVSSSVLPEAGPMTVVEAMSVGLPVVATDHGGPRDYLADGRGELVAPGDPAAMAAAIRRLLADPVRCHELGVRGRRLVADRFDRAVTFPAQYTAVMT